MEIARLREATAVSTVTPTDESGVEPRRCSHVSSRKAASRSVELAVHSTQAEMTRRVHREHDIQYIQKYRTASHHIHHLLFSPTSKPYYTAHS